MACNILLKSTYLSGASSGGSWDLVGHSLVETGPYVLGSGNWPWNSNVNEDPTIDPTNIDHGFYKLNYYLGGQCGGSVDVIVPIVGSGDAGVSKVIDVCSTSSIIDIAQELGSEYDDGAFAAQFSYGGTGSVSAAFNNPNTNTPIGATFDPSLAATGSYILTLTITPIAPVGYPLHSCTSCDPTSAILTINVTEPDLEIDVSGCTISLVSEVGCVGSTKQLQKLIGSTWTNISGSLPYTSTDDAEYRITAICSCGTVTSNSVETIGCCCSQSAFATGGLYYDAGSCFLVLNGSSCTTSGIGQYQYQISSDGINWANYGGVIIGAGGTLIFPTTNGFYRLLILNCFNGCLCVSNTVEVLCGSACNGAIGSTQSGCSVTFPTLPCTSGFWQWQKKIGSSWVTQTSGTGIVPTSQTATSDGLWRLTIDCQNGCPVFYSTEMTFTGCGSSCSATAVISNSGCTLSCAVTNCTTPSYQWTLNGNNISGATASSFTAASDGNYQCIVSGCPSCPPISSNTLSITGCAANPCVCSASISQTSCVLSLNQSCSGYTWVWQYRLNTSSTWSTIQTSGLTHTPANNGQYRVVLSKAGCSNVNTNTSTVTCVTSSCQVQIDSFVVDPNDCSKAIVSWSGAMGSNVSVQFSKATVNPTDCNNAGGWQTLIGANTSASTNGTGTSTITIDANDCDACIRALVDATGTVCGIDTEKLFVPCCCNDNPSISDSDSSVNYTADVEDLNGIINKIDIEPIVDSHLLRAQGVANVYRDLVLYSQTSFDLICNARLRISSGGLSSDVLFLNDIIKEVRFYRSDTNSLIDLPLAPTTAILTGVGGTIVSSDLMYDPLFPNDFADSVKVAIINYIYANGMVTLDDSLVEVIVINNTLSVRTYHHHNPTVAHAGLNTNDRRILYTSNGVDKVVTQGNTANFAGTTDVELINATPCGDLYLDLNNTSLVIDQLNSNYNSIVLSTNNPTVNYVNSPTPSRTCIETELDVINECSGSTYLWSTSETSSSIVVGSGTYSVIVTCPDGCDYTISITV